MGLGPNRLKLDTKKKKIHMTGDFFWKVAHGIREISRDGYEA